MQGTQQLRRLPRIGWSIESHDGRIQAIKRDDGTVTPLIGPLMGTREAAHFLGVQPSNFVRDWAARVDFPSPVAILSSGRIWLADDVGRYALQRRAPGPTDERVAEIARRVVWWQESGMTLKRPLEFVGRVMARGTHDEVRDVERRFGQRTLREAWSQASPGVFDRRSWNYWRLAFGLDRSTPLPTRQVP